MLTVLYALIPATVAFVWFYGIGVLINLAVAVAAAAIAESAALRVQRRPVLPALADGSAVVAGVLYALCLPPLCPWWVTATGIAFAMVFVKHVFGGLGHNLFNPAMAGYVLVLVSFPDAMTVWPAPDIGDIDYVRPGPGATLVYALTGQFPDALNLDAVTQATVLDLEKTGLTAMQTMQELRTSPMFGDFGGSGWEWVGNFVALGGLWLLFAGVIRWHTLWLADSSTHPSPGFHLFTGGALLGAFFVATDPVSSPTTPRGRLLYGAGIGILTYVIRSWGSYPDGVAFAVLLMNAAVPLIERFTAPVIYGHPRR
jgi:electron transport complex protein RnfD